MADVFVSYSRRDGDFVRRLSESIVERGKEVWLDTQGIEDAELFPDATKRAIERSDAFLFVLLQKRIVPVLREPVPDSALAPEIRDRNWVPFTTEPEFEPGVDRVIHALDTDLDAARAHTRWLTKALEWQAERPPPTPTPAGSRSGSLPGGRAAALERHLGTTGRCGRQP